MAGGAGQVGLVAGEGDERFDAGQPPLPTPSRPAERNPNQKLLPAASAPNPLSAPLRCGYRVPGIGVAKAAPLIGGRGDRHDPICCELFGKTFVCWLHSGIMFRDLVHDIRLSELSVCDPVVQAHLCVRLFRDRRRAS